MSVPLFEIHIMTRFLFLIAVSCFSVVGRGQDTLPKFSVKNLGNDRDGNPRVVISWVNRYDSLAQISIQTSHDSLRGYRTLISLTDPNARFNGFADTKAPNDHMYYRLFLVKPGGEYFFSAIKRPVLDTARNLTERMVGETKKPTVTERTDVTRRPDFIPSFYVYTNKDGYVYVNLPDADKQQYRIRFYEEDQSLLFELKSVKQSGLTLDKTNFMRAGWYFFELFNGEKLMEKHKFYLAREF